jgi:hypothetical protein
MSNVRADLLAILYSFAETKYTPEQLNRLIKKEQLVDSWIYQEGFADGQAQGRTQGLAEGLVAGQLAATRELCRETVRHWHPRAGKKLWKAIDHCTDLAALKEVTINASEWGPRDILRRLTAR